MAADHGATAFIPSFFSFYFACFFFFFFLLRIFSSNFFSLFWSAWPHGEAEMGGVLGAAGAVFWFERVYGGEEV
jgi:hypothetical protein